MLHYAVMIFSSQGKQLSVIEFRSSLVDLDNPNRRGKLGDARYNLRKESLRSVKRITSR